jgi:FSR family fosmidomycin resistance protein-like MFS transporter
MFYRLITAKLKATSLLRLTLFSAPLLDEVISGFLSIGLPLANKQLGLDYTQVGLLFGIGALASLLLDPFINLLSDRYAKRYWILGGLLLMGTGFAFTAGTHNFVLLLCAFALIYVADSAATGLSEAALIDQNPQGSARTMTRWTIMASIGDLLGPILVSLILIQAAGWSKLCWIACIACLVMACILGIQRFPKPVQNDDDEEDTPSIRLLDGLREALRDAELVRWTMLSLIPTMLDEIFIVYATFYLRDVLSINTGTIGLLIAIHMIGGFLGLFVIDRVLLQRMTPERLLTWLALLVIASMVGFLTLRSIIWAGAMLFFLGLGVAGLYPIATAEAYKRFPGRSGTVRTVASLGAPFEVVLPYITGFVAGRFGVVASLCLLGTAPLLILLLRPGRK